MSNLTNQISIVQTNFAALVAGFYTIVFTAHNTHRTLRIKKAKNGGLKDCLVISKLIGTDNTSDYEGIAHITLDGSLRVWQRSGLDDAQKASLAYSLRLIMGDSAQYGKNYALQSGNCYRCNRLLTNPESIADGIGPECKKKA